jgi:CBS domain-containing protein
MEGLTVRDIMITDVATATPDMSIRELAELLANRKISGVPVIDGDRHVLGMVSEADVILQDAELHFPKAIPFLLDSVIYVESFHKFRERYRKAFALKVSEIMTKRVVSISPTASVHEAATLMADKKVNRLPVVEAEKLVGILTRGDIVRAIAQHKA